MGLLSLMPIRNLKPFYVVTSKGFIILEGRKFLFNTQGMIHYNFLWIDKTHMAGNATSNAKENLRSLLLITQEYYKTSLQTHGRNAEKDCTGKVITVHSFMN